MFQGDFSTFKTVVLRLCTALWVVLSITSVVSILFSALDNSSTSDAIELSGSSLELFLFTILVCLVVSLIVGLVALLVWILFFPPSALLRFVAVFVLVTVVGFGVLIFLESSFYVSFRDWLQDLIKRLTEG